jgi:adenylate kinase
MLDLIVIAGAPGSGKTTICNILKEKLDSPMITYGHIRGFHLNSSWSNMTSLDDEMTFENIRFIIGNYLKNNYRNIIINDFEDFRIKQISQIYSNLKYAIFTLYVDNDLELKSRVLNESRDSGFRDYNRAIEWNKIIKERLVNSNEFIIDNTSKDCQIAVNEILKMINKEN